MDATDKKKDGVLSLRAEGLPVEQIVAKTGLEPQAVVDMIADAHNEIITLRGIRQEAELRKVGADTAGRLKRMVSLRDKIQAELDTRDLSDVPTEKLLQIAIKMNEAIKDEATAPRILSTGTYWEKPVDVAEEM